jgi:hypothetical protein
MGSPGGSWETTWEAKRTAARGIRRNNIFVIFVIFVKKTPLLRLLLRWYVCIILLFLKSRSSPIEKCEDTYGYVRVRVSDEGGGVGDFQ